jgi:Skp family chaperone for outer membrane proteins
MDNIGGLVRRACVRDDVFQARSAEVRPTQIVAAVAACALCVVFAFPALAQQQPQPAAPTQGLQPGPANIAVIDIAAIYKAHTRFTQMMNEIKADMEAADGVVKKERDTLKGMVDSMEQFRSGTPDYKRLEEEIARRQADLATRVQLQKKEFLLREARVHYSVYQEIMQEVDYFAASHGIAMVFRFNSDPVDVERPEDVLRHINKPIVWVPQGCNITPYVLERLNRAQLNNANAQPMRQGVPVQR